MVEVEGHELGEITKNVGLEHAEVISPQVQQLQTVQSVEGPGHEVTQLVAAQLQGPERSQFVKEAVRQLNICISQLEQSQRRQVYREKNFN